MHWPSEKTMEVFFGSKRMMYNPTSNVRESRLSGHLVQTWCGPLWRLILVNLHRLERWLDWQGSVAPLLRLFPFALLSGYQELSTVKFLPLSQLPMDWTSETMSRNKPLTFSWRADWCASLSNFSLQSRQCSVKPYVSAFPPQEQRHWVSLPGHVSAFAKGLFRYTAHF